MDEMQTHNRVILCGTPLSSPVFSHASRLEPFYTFPLEVARLSGTVDTINVLLREELLPEETGRTYTECDINTLGADSRRAERLIFSNDGLYFYTSDHYASFTELTVDGGTVIWN